MKCKSIRDIFVLVGFLENKVYLRQVVSLQDEERFEESLERLFIKPLVEEQLFVVTKERYNSEYFTEKEPLTRETRQRIRDWYMGNKRFFDLPDLELI